jgi:hypothetical protein
LTPTAEARREALTLSRKGEGGWFGKGRGKTTGAISNIVHIEDPRQ